MIIPDVSAPTSRTDLFTRASLLFPQFGFAGALLQFKTAIESESSEAELNTWQEDAVSSPVAISLIRRFSTVEGDTWQAGLKGQGRLAAPPRIGRLICRAEKSRNLTLFSGPNAVALCVHASYLSMLHLAPRDVAVKDIDPETVWEKWIRHAYDLAHAGDMETLQTIGSYSAPLELWDRILSEYGLKRAQKALQRKNSELAYSLLCLTSVGAQLAVAEQSVASASASSNARERNRSAQSPADETLPPPPSTSPPPPPPPPPSRDQTTHLGDVPSVPDDEYSDDLEEASAFALALIGAPSIAAQSHNYDLDDYPTQDKRLLMACSIAAQTDYHTLQTKAPWHPSLDAPIIGALFALGYGALEQS